MTARLRRFGIVGVLLIALLVAGCSPSRSNLERKVRDQAQAGWDGAVAAAATNTDPVVEVLRAQFGEPSYRVETLECGLDHDDAGIMVKTWYNHCYLRAAVSWQGDRTTLLRVINAHLELFGYADTEQSDSCQASYARPFDQPYPDTTAGEFEELQTYAGDAARCNLATRALESEPWTMTGLQHRVLGTPTDEPPTSGDHVLLVTKTKVARTGLGCHKKLFLFCDQPIDVAIVPDVG